MLLHYISLRQWDLVLTDCLADCLNIRPEVCSDVVSMYIYI